MNVPVYPKTLYTTFPRKGLGDVGPSKLDSFSYLLCNLLYINLTTTNNRKSAAIAVMIRVCHKKSRPYPSLSNASLVNRHINTVVSQTSSIIARPILKKQKYDRR